MMPLFIFINDNTSSTLLTSLYMTVQLISTVDGISSTLEIKEVETIKPCNGKIKLTLRKSILETTDDIEKAIIALSMKDNFEVKDRGFTILIHRSLIGSVSL